MKFLTQLLSESANGPPCLVRCGAAVTLAGVLLFEIAAGWHGTGLRITIAESALVLGLFGLLVWKRKVEQKDRHL